MAPRVNFVRTARRNYAEVQNQILGQIQACMPPDSYSETLSEKADGRLNFSLFIQQPSDVVMSHGVADKNYFFRHTEDGERISNSLKHVFVPGEWLRQRLLKAKSLTLSPEQIHAVGWPRLDRLLALQARHPPAPREGRKPKVLWAPPHDYARRGEDKVSTSSYPDLMPYLDYLNEHLDLEVSLHPRNRKDKKPTEEKLIECDYVISDFGTMVYEAWALGRPVIFPSWIIGDRIVQYLRQAAEAHIFREGIGHHARSPEEIVDLAVGGADLGPGVQSFLGEYLEPAHHGRSAQRIAALLQDLS